MLYTKVKHN